MFKKFKEDVENSLVEVIRKLDYTTSDLKLEEPREISDLASTIPFELASHEGCSPQKIGKEIVENLKIGEYENIDRVEFSSPGYINFFINRKRFPKEVKRILELGDNFGHAEDKTERIVLEHTSANPTGPLHIGHLRNAIIGDTLSRLLSTAGYEVERQYYLNDMGKQVAILVHGLENFEFDDNKKPDHAIGEIYAKANKIAQRDERSIKKLIVDFERGIDSVEDRFEEAVSLCYKGIKKTLHKLDIRHDISVRESRFVHEGWLEDILDKLDNYTVDEEGSVQIKFKDIDKEFVLLRSDGTSVYALRDLAYHIWKSGRGSMIDIMGSDHKLYSKQLNKTLSLLNTPIPEMIIFEFVSLPSGKMSTREGEFISVDELISEVEKKAFTEVSKRREEKSKEWLRETARKVAKGAIRYDFARVAPEKQITFDMDKAINFDEQAAPFIQYSYARANSILEKSPCEIEKNLNLNFNINEISEEPTINLLKTIFKLEYEVEKCAKNKNLPRFAEYLFQLASKFNIFYRDVPVLNVNKNKTSTRLAVVKAYKIALSNGMDILGLDKMEEM